MQHDHKQKAEIDKQSFIHYHKGNPKNTVTALIDRVQLKLSSQSCQHTHDCVCKIMMQNGKIL